MVGDKIRVHTRVRLSKIILLHTDLPNSLTTLVYPALKPSSQTNIYYIPWYLAWQVGDGEPFGGQKKEREASIFLFLAQSQQFHLGWLHLFTKDSAPIKQTFLSSYPFWAPVTLSVCSGRPSVGKVTTFLWTLQYFTQIPLQQRTCRPSASAL